MALKFGCKEPALSLRWVGLVSLRLGGSNLEWTNFG